MKSGEKEDTYTPPPLLCFWASFFLSLKKRETEGAKRQVSTLFRCHPLWLPLFPLKKDRVHFPQAERDEVPEKAELLFGFPFLLLFLLKKLTKKWRKDR